MTVTDYWTLLKPKLFNSLPAVDNPKYGKVLPEDKAPCQSVQPDA
jgi:hypothetical protein